MIKYDSCGTVVMFVDIHCHLEREQLLERLDAVIGAAREAGVGMILTSGITPATNDAAFSFAEKYPDLVKATAGLYPLDAIGMGEFIEGLPRKSEPFDVDAELERLQKMPDRFVAFGEIGLDYKWTKEESQKEAQVSILNRILAVAEKMRKPVIIHSRSAEKECIEILEASSLKQVVMHCFMGNKKLIQRGADAGFFFSIPPVITRLQHFQTVADIVPMEQLLTETDAPWMGPQPGPTNEPKNVVLTVAEIAKVKKLDAREVEEAIWQNAQELFAK